MASTLDRRRLAALLLVLLLALAPSLTANAAGLTVSASVTVVAEDSVDQTVTATITGVAVGVGNVSLTALSLTPETIPDPATATCAAVASEISCPVQFTPVAHAFMIEAWVSFTATQPGSGRSSAPTTVQVDVLPVADAPEAGPNPAATDEDTLTGAITIGRNAVDGSEVTHFRFEAITGGALYQADGVTPIANGDTLAIDAGGTMDVHFLPAANQHGAATGFGFQARACTSAAGDGLGVATTIGVDVTSLNDAPTVTAPATVTLAEDTPLVFLASGGNAITVADVDAGTASLTLTADATSGSLTLASLDGLTLVSGDGTGDAHVVCTGSLGSIAAALDGLAFAPTADYAGAASVTVKLNDGGNSGGGGAKEAQQTVAITVTAANDAPVLTAPDAQSVNEDSPLIFSSVMGNGISITDVDAGTGSLTLQLEATGGTVTGTGLTGSGTASASLTSTLTAVNTALRNLRFSPTADTHGAAQLLVTVNDNGNTGGAALEVQRAIAITVMPLADTPTAGEAATAEDTPSPEISLYRAAADGAEVGYIRLSIYTGGTLFAAGGTTPIVSGSWVALPPSGILPVVFAPNANHNGTGSFQVSAALDGTGTGASTAASVTVTISAVNDAPSLTLPSGQATAEDTPLTFGSATGNLVAISDIDVGSGSVTVNLAAQHGRLTLHGVAGLTFTAGDGTDDLALAFTGMLSDANNALNGMQFVPDAAFFGTGASVGISMGDQGNTGAGGELLAEGNVAITVAAQPDTPTATAPGPTAEDTQSDAATIHRSAADGDEIAYLRVSGITNGSVYLNDGTTPVLEGGVLAMSEPDGVRLRFTPAANLNDATSAFGFDVRACGDALCTMQSPAARVSLSVTAVNDPPTYVKGADRLANASAGPVSITGWATAVAPGPADEAAQSVAFTLSTTSTDLFAVPPALSASGTLTYTPDAARRGTATVTIAGADSLGLAAADQSFLITVNALPAVTLPGPAWTHVEGDPATVIDSDATIGDADGPASLNGGQLTVEFAAGGEAGDELAIGVGADTGITVSGTNVDYTSTVDLVTTTVTVGMRSGGTDGAPLVVALNGNSALPAVEALLRSITYRSTSDAPSAAARTVRMRLTDGFVPTDGSALGLPVDRVIAVQPVDDAPVVTVPAPQAAQENTPLPFTPAAGNGITVADPDAGTCAVTMTVTATHGTFTLRDTTQLAEVAGDGTALLTARGTLAAVNLALVGSRFTPETSYRGGSAGLSLLVDDNGCSGGTTGLTATGLVPIDVRPTADVPVISPANPSTREDVALAGLVIARNANDGDEVTHFKLTTVSGGLLYLADDVTPAPVGSFITVAEGEAGLVFHPDAEFSGTATVRVRASVSALDSGLGPETAVASITVLSVNDQPTFVAGASQVVAEDADSRVVAGWATGISAGAANESAQTLAFVVEAVTPALFAIQPSVTAGGALTFTPAEDACGTTQVSVTLRDSGGNANGGVDTSATRTFTITLVAVPEAPTVTGATTGEDAITYAGLVVARSARDGAEVTHFRISGITNGSVYLSDGTTAVPEGGFVTVAQGDAGLRFRPARDFSGIAHLTVQGATAALASATGAASTTADISVAAMNDAPVNGLPASPATYEDTPLRFSAGGGNAVTISDPDASPGGLLVTLAANHGTLSLYTTAGLTFATGGGDGTGDAFMEFSGEVAAVNAALAGLTFVPAPDYSGTGASVLVSSSDGGRSGAGGVQHDVDLMAIAVLPVPDRPRASYAQSVTGSQAGSRVSLIRNAVDGTEVTHFRISSIRGGTLALSGGTAVADGSYVTVDQGSDGLVLTPAPGFSGLATFTVQAATAGNSGAALSQAVVAAVAVGQTQNLALSPSAAATLTAESAAGQTLVSLPAGSVAEPVTLTYVAMGSPNQGAPSGLGFAGRAFTLAAIDAHGGLVHPFPFQQPITVTLDYTGAAMDGIDEASLKLYYWDGAAWRDAASTCTTPWVERRPTENRLSVRICHLTEFALMGQSMGDFRAYAPLAAAAYHAFTNGDFGGGIMGWQTTRGGYGGHGSGLPASGVTFDGSTSALIGLTGAQNGYLPVGYGAVNQSMPVSGRYLQVRYRVVTQDIVRSTSRYYDTFEVSLNAAPAAITDAQRDQRGCTGAALNPDGTLVPSGDGLALCGGYSGVAGAVGTTHDLGWKTVSIDMAGFSGEVTLYLAVWNRESKAPYYDDRGWYNTIAYVDYVRFSDTP